MDNNTVEASTSAAVNPQQTVQAFASLNKAAGPAVTVADPVALVRQQLAQSVSAPVTPAPSTGTPSRSWVANHVFVFAHFFLNFFLGNHVAESASFGPEERIKRQRGLDQRTQHQKDSRSQKPNLCLMLLLLGKHWMRRWQWCV